MAVIIGFIVSWLVLLWWFIGIGLGIRRIFGRPELTIRGLLILFWVGWGVSLALLQIWQLFWPVSWVAYFPLGAVGMLGIYSNRKAIVRWLCGMRSAATVGRLAGIAVGTLAILAIVIMSSLQPFNFDTGLYEMGVAKWETEYSIVPGLANLHDRFGFNSSNLLYFALLEAGPWTTVSQHYGHGVLAVCLLALTASGVKNVWRCRDQAKEWYLALAFAPALMETAQSASGMSSDYAVLAVQIVIGYVLMRFWFSEMSSDEARFSTFTVVFLAALALTIKLSSLVFSLVAVVLTLVLLFRRFPEEERNGALLAFLAFSSGLLLIPWVIRGYILSGYPAFPSTTGGISFEWQVPPARAEQTRRVTVDWARFASFTSEEPEGRLGWLAPWTRGVVRRPDRLGGPLSLTGLGFGALWVASRRGVSVSRDVLFLLAFVLPLVFWFLTVPLLEFVQGPLWFLASAAAALGFVRLRESLSRTRWIENGALALVSLTITAAALVGFGVSADVNQEFRIPDVPKAESTEIQTDSGLVIHAIEGDQRAFLAPLPNTPRSEYQPDLSLRHAGDLGSGFVINSP